MAHAFLFCIAVVDCIRNTRQRGSNGSRSETIPASPLAKQSLVNTGFTRLFAFSPLPYSGEKRGALDPNLTPEKLSTSQTTNLSKNQKVAKVI